MPVCGDCARYWSPRSAASGRCPDCGGPIAASTIGGPKGGEKERLPWHLKLLAVSFCLYMGYRLYQGVEWLVHHL